MQQVSQLLSELEKNQGFLFMQREEDIERRRAVENAWSVRRKTLVRRDLSSYSSFNPSVTVKTTFWSKKFLSWWRTKMWRVRLYLHSEETKKLEEAKQKMITEKMQELRVRRRIKKYHYIFLNPEQMSQSSVSLSGHGQSHRRAEPPAGRGVGEYLQQEEESGADEKRHDGDQGAPEGQAWGTSSRPLTDRHRASHLLSPFLKLIVIITAAGPTAE